MGPSELVLEGAMGDKVGAKVVFALFAFLAALAVSALTKLQRAKMTPAMLMREKNFMINVR